MCDAMFSSVFSDQKQREHTTTMFVPENEEKKKCATDLKCINKTALTKTGIFYGITFLRDESEGHRQNNISCS